MEQLDLTSWAIITQGGLRFIGRLPPSGGSTLSPAYEITTHVIPVPTQGGIMMQKEISCAPILTTLERSSMQFVGSYAIQRLADLSEGDRRRYTGLVNNAERMAQEIRMRDAGIVLPGAKG